MRLTILIFLAIMLMGQVTPLSEPSRMHLGTGFCGHCRSVPMRIPRRYCQHWRARRITP